MNPLDPAVAVLRCWEHEDCLEHPELGLACAAGLATEWAAGVAEGTDGAFLTDWSFGDGYGYANGGGDGVDDFTGEGQAFDEHPTWIAEDRMEDWEINATLEFELDRLGW